MPKQIGFFLFLKSGKRTSSFARLYMNIYVYIVYFISFFHDYVLVGVGKPLTVQLYFIQNYNALMTCFLNEVSVI